MRAGGWVIEVDCPLDSDCPKHSGAFAMQRSISAEELKRVKGRRGPEVPLSRDCADL